MIKLGIVALGPSEFDDQRLALDVTKIAKPSTKRSDLTRIARQRSGTQESDPVCPPCLLALSGERPGEEHRTRACEERAPVDHWITWYETNSEAEQQASGRLTSEAGEA